MKKFLTKKVIAGIIIVLLGIGVVFGEKINIKDYWNKVTEIVSKFDLTE